MLKKLFSIILAISIYTGINAQNLVPADADSKIAFVIKNMGTNVEGTLKGLKGKISFNPKKPAASLFDVTVEVQTVDTDNKRRDDHLKRSDFFDVEKYPVIAIKTSSIQSKGNDIYFAKAVLTMHGISKNIQFDFIAKPVQGGYNFKGTFSVDRKEFGIGGNSMTMGDNVKVNLDVIARK